MSLRSKFTDKVISKPRAKLEEWLLDLGYDSVADHYPAAIEALTLLDDFLQEFPDMIEFRSILKKHCQEIGFISDYGELDEEEEDIDNFNEDELYD